MRSIALAIVSVVVASTLAACSSDSTGGEGGAGGSGSPSSSSGSPSATSGSPSSNNASTGATTGPGAGTGGGGTCGMLTTYDACDECECTAHQAGCDSWYMIEDDKCICGMGTPCATACAASYCTGANSDMACDTCLNGLTGEEPCYTDVATACDADPDCKAYVTASDASCGDLP